MTFEEKEARRKELSEKSREFVTNDGPCLTDLEVLELSWLQSEFSHYCSEMSDNFYYTNGRYERNKRDCAEKKRRFEAAKERTNAIH